MTLFKSIVVGGCLAALTVVGTEENSGPLKSTSSALANGAEKTLKTETVKPEIKDNRIISGNKALQVRDDGVMFLFTGNERKPVKIEFSYKTDSIYGNIGMRTKKDASGGFDKETQTFSLTANYPMLKPDAGDQKYFNATQKVSLAPDGIINVTVSWDIPEKDKQLFKTAYVGLRWEDSKHGEKVLCGGKERIVSNMEGEKYWWFASTKKSGEEIEFFPNRPEESFKLIPKDFSNILISSTGAPEKAKLDGSMTQDPGLRNSMSFALDIR